MFCSEMSDEDMLGDSDDESDNGDAMDLTLEEKQSRLDKLVPNLPTDQWGMKTQTIDHMDIDEPEIIQRTGTGKQVSFAPGTKAPLTHPERKPRPPMFEPEQYEGHVEESDDESDDGDVDNGYSNPMGWGAAPVKGKEKPRKVIDASVHALQESLRTGVPMPADQLKETVLGDSLELSSDESEDEESGEGDGRKTNGKGEVDVDMDNEEEEFLRFARDALGINEEMWNGIVTDRKAKGGMSSEAQATLIKTDIIFYLAYVPGDKPASSSQAIPKPVPDQKPEPKLAPEYARTEKQPVERNPNLDSFDKVMDAMEAELGRAKKPIVDAKLSKGQKKKAKAKAKKTGTDHSAGTSGKLSGLANLPSEEDLEDMPEDELAAMDRELRAALKSAGIDDEDSDADSDMDAETKDALNQLGDGEKQEFRMMKELLGSYKAQGGGSGVVGNLFGRLSEGNAQR